jgi:hypothetical protein
MRESLGYLGHPENRFASGQTVALILRFARTRQEACRTRWCSRLLTNDDQENGPFAYP